MRDKVITIVGLGLLGGSYAMGLKKAGNTVYGIDIKQESIDYALCYDFIDEGSVEDFEKYLCQSDCIVLCLYPSVLIKWIEKYAPVISQNTIITDVCGVKSQLVERVQSYLEPYGIEFYSAHPMRGKEVLGIENADNGIFKNANLILTPTERNSKRAEDFIIDMGKTLGFTVFSYLSLEDHDRMIGYLSQLTHAIAVSLMTSHAGKEEIGIYNHLVQYSGDSFRDLTRIAKIDEYLWSELFFWNKDILSDEIDAFIENLRKLQSFINTNDKHKLEEMFRLSTECRTKFDK